MLVLKSAAFPFFFLDNLKRRVMIHTHRSSVQQQDRKRGLNCLIPAPSLLLCSWNERNHIIVLQSISPSVLTVEAGIMDSIAPYEEERERESRSSLLHVICRNGGEFTFS